MNEDVPIPTTVWRRKEILNDEDCRIALTAEECKEEYEWYIDSGCSSHMTRDQDKFISLKRKGGNVAFGDESCANTWRRCSRAWKKKCKIKECSIC